MFHFSRTFHFPLGYFCLTCLLYLGFPHFLRADTLYYRDGREIEGRFLRIEKGAYKFQTEEGKILYVPEEQVDDLRQLPLGTDSVKKPLPKEPQAKDLQEQQEESAIEKAKAEEIERQKAEKLRRQKTEKLRRQKTEKLRRQKAEELRRRRQKSIEAQREKERQERILLADTLYYRDGRKIQGRFLRIEKGAYKFQTEEGKILYIPEEQVDDLQQLPLGTDSVKKPIPKEPQTKDLQEQQEESTIEKAKAEELEKQKTEKIERQKAEELRRQKAIETQREKERQEGSPIPEEEEKEQKTDFAKANTFELGGFRFSLHFSLGMGDSELQYKDKARSATIPYSIGGETHSLPVEQYPNSYSGSSLRISGHAEKIWKPRLDIQAGLDYSQVMESGNDRPAKAGGEVDLMGADIGVRNSYKSAITYSYFSLFTGLRYSLSQFYVNPQIRLPIPILGSYDIKETVESRYVLPGEASERRVEGSTSASGSMGLGGIGFGIKLGKEWPLSTGYRLSVELLYSQDKLKLGSDGTQYSHNFFGLSCGVKLD